MGPKSNRQKAKELILASGRTILADKRKAEDELKHRDDEIEYLLAKNRHTQAELEQMNDIIMEQQRIIQKFKLSIITKSQNENSIPSVNGTISSNVTRHSLRSTWTDYPDVCSRQKNYRQAKVRKMILESGLAKSDEGYRCLIRDALPRSERKYLRENIDGRDTSSSDSDIGEQPWLLALEPPNLHSQNKSCKQYITYSHNDKNFVLGALVRCISREEISIGIGQLISLYPKYRGVTVSRIICWRKASAGELKIPGTKVNKEFESDIWSRLLLCVLKENIDLTGKEPKKIIKAEVVVNVTYSYDVVKTAAVEAQESPQWKGIKDIQGLKFSNW